MELAGITAVITGSSGRLGGAITVALAQAGCNCVCHYYQNAGQAETIVEQVKALGADAVAVKADLRSAEGIKKLFAEAQNLPPARILINSASVFSREELSEITLERSRSVFDINLISPILVSREFMKIATSNFSGTAEPFAGIINLVDVGAAKPWAGYSLYCASKAGLVAATKSMAKELAPAICVNALAPGIVNFPGGFNERAKKRQLDKIPAGRLAATDEIASAVMFLLGNDYITGEVLNVDGGRSV